MNINTKDFRRTLCDTQNLNTDLNSRHLEPNNCTQYSHTDIAGTVGQFVFFSDRREMCPHINRRYLLNLMYLRRRYRKQMKQHSMSMVVSTGMIVEFGDLNNPIKLLSMAEVLQTW